MGNVNGTHRVRFDAMSFRRGERGCLGIHGNCVTSGQHEAE
jgi:hypothetical protein